MTPFNNLVHYMWVGNAELPPHFYDNFVRTKDANPEFEFLLWTDDKLVDELPVKYSNFKEFSLYHKLQIARYGIANIHGGMVCDFDVVWKTPITDVYDWFGAPTSLIFPYRDSTHFSTSGYKTTLVDDFVFCARPRITGNFLEYCEFHVGNPPHKEHVTHPYSVWNLTEWLIGQPNVKYLSHKQISESPDSTLAIHENKRTWES